MKKLLITILSIFGICFSFCSAEDFTINFYNNSFTVIDLNNNNTEYNNVSFSHSSDYRSSNGPELEKYPSFEFSGLNSDVILKSVCFYVRDTDYYRFHFSNTIIDNNGQNLKCFNFNTNLKDSGYVLNYLFATPDWSDTQWSFGSANSSVAFSCEERQYFNIYFPGLISSMPDFGIRFWGGTDNYCGAFGIPYSITFSVESGPKFKVNYGNTSYQYELEDNLFIHLKSPTIQNGNIFSYAGSTGINLFYNGISQFYSKSNLYLESMYWFNNNIFTPICL